MKTSQYLGRPTRRATLAIGMIVSLFACGGGGHHDSSNAIGGTITFVGEDISPAIETEPDDSVDQPQSMGALQAGRDIVIRG